MFKYEMKKIFTPKKTILTSIILVVVTSIIFFMDTSTANYNEIQRLGKIYTGEVNSQIFIEAKKHADEIRDNKEYYTDTGEIKPEIREIFKDYETPESCIKINDIRRNLWGNIENDKDGYSEKQLLIANEYISRIANLKELTHGDTVSISFLERYIAGFLPFIMAFVIAMFISPLFSSEYELKTDSLLLTSRYGKNKLINIKIMAALTATLILYIFVVGGYFLLTLIKWGMFNTKASFIFTSPDNYIYLYSPFEFTMGQYFGVMIGISFIACLVFSLFTILLSSTMKKTLVVAITSMIFIFIPNILTKSFSMTMHTLPNILRLNFANVMSVRGVFDSFYAFTIGNHVVTIASLLIPVLVISSTVYYAIIKYAFKNHQIS